LRRLNQQSIRISILRRGIKNLKLLRMRLLSALLIFRFYKDLRELIPLGAKEKLGLLSDP